jgi:hypothetical protein
MSSYMRMSEFSVVHKSAVLIMHRFNVNNICNCNKYQLTYDQKPLQTTKSILINAHKSQRKQETVFIFIKT